MEGRPAAVRETEGLEMEKRRGERKTETEAQTEGQGEAERQRARRTAGHRRADRQTDRQTDRVKARARQSSGPRAHRNVGVRRGQHRPAAAAARAGGTDPPRQDAQRRVRLARTGRALHDRRVNCSLSKKIVCSYDSQCDVRPSPCHAVCVLPAPGGPCARCGERVGRGRDGRRASCASGNPHAHMLSTNSHRHTRACAHTRTHECARAHTYAHARTRAYEGWSALTRLPLSRALPIHAQGRPTRRDPGVYAGAHPARPRPG
jgi:hypothetical protein